MPATNTLLKIKLVTFFYLLCLSSVKAQENALTNNLEIIEVVYEKDGVFYTQSSENAVPTSATSSTLTLDDNDEVTIYRITYDEDGNTGTTADQFDVYPKADDVNVTSFAQEIINNDANSGNIRVEEPNDVTTDYDAPGGTFDNDGLDDFELAIERIIAIPDIRSYWSIDGPGLGSNEDGGTGANDTYDFFMTFEFYEKGTFDASTGNGDRTFTEPDAIFLATERRGNSPMLFTALNQSGGDIGNLVEIPASGTGDYQWETGFQNSNDAVGNQTIHLHLFSNELFFEDNPGAAENIYGFQVDLDKSYADGSVIAFRDPQTRITGGECWRTLSSPIDGSTYADLLENIWTQGLPGSDYPGAGAANSNVLLWDRTYDGEDETVGWTTTDPNTSSTLDLNSTIEPGTGFLVSVFADDDFDGTADDFPKVLGVKGKENNSTVSPTMNSNADGWTLLGNPYGAPIDWNDVTANSGTSNITNVAYVYDRNASGATNGNSGVWISHNGSTGDIENGLIAPFQGFFVQNASSGTPEVEMQLNDRTSLSAVDDWEFYGKTEGERIQHIRLEVEGEQVYNSAWISFADFGSNDRIIGDAYELIPFSENYAMLSTRKGDELFDIGQFSYNEDLSIPLNLETTLAGSYTLRATRFDPGAASDLVFTDTQENISIPFDENFEYEFEVQQAAKANPDPLQCGATAQELAAKYKPQKASPQLGDRFLIQHASLANQVLGSEQPSEFGLDQNYPNPFNPTTQITYQLPRQSDVRLEVFDMNGRQVATLVNQSVTAGSHTVSFDATNLSSGVYMYRLQAGSTVLTRKLTLIK